MKRLDLDSLVCVNAECQQFCCVGAGNLVIHKPKARLALSTMAAVATFLLGVVAGAAQLVVAGAVGVGVAVLLVAKPHLEAFSCALSSEELSAVLELAMISVIVLPLLPNQDYGP